MLRRFFALTTLFSIYIFPATVRATITPIQLNYEAVGMPKEETKSFSKDNTSDLISEKSAKNDKKKVNSFIKFLGLLALSYIVIEILDSDSSTSTTSTTSTTSSTPSIYEEP